MPHKLRIFGATTVTYNLANMVHTLSNFFFHIIVHYVSKHIAYCSFVNGVRL